MHSIFNNSIDIISPMITGNQTPREQKTLITKQKLYLTALSLFSEKGYDAVSVSEICKKAGYTKGAFYNSFTSKHDILVIQLQEVDEFHRIVFKTMPADFGPTQKIIHFITQTAKKFDEIGYAVLKSLYLAELSPSSSVHYTLNTERPVYSGLKQIIEEGQRTGVFNPDSEPEKIVAQILHYIRGVLFEWTLSNGGFDLCKEFQHMIDNLEIIKQYLKSETGHNSNDSARYDGSLTKKMNLNL
ncbi:MAG: TetR/AcrR family transcriptional regulator [Dehalococcoidia bacterium]|jgi:AcrR family transcriptional regulator